MVLRVVPIPDAIVGNDWKHTVPGRYLYDVTGVQAVLNGSTALAAADASGNGNGGAYVFSGPPLAGGNLGRPGAVAGDAAIYTSPLAGGGDQVRVAHAGPSTMVWSANFTVEWWQRLAGPAWFPNNLTVDFAANQAQVGQNVTGRLALILNGAGDRYETAGAGALFDDAWHHYVWSYTAANPATTTLYRDGVAQTLAVRPVTNPAIAASDIDYIVGTLSSQGAGGLDEVALYPAALSAARAAAHYAARGDFATYSAAVLADAPAVYYHLDEVGGPGGRAPALEITDGSTIVELVPSGFPRSATVGTQTFSWQPRLRAGAESADETLVTVPTPELILPAGYTIGSFTPDLGPNDQWTDIVLWWDDAYQTATQQADSYQYAPGAHLVYQQQRAAP